MSNAIPKGWSEYRQGDVAEFSNGRAYKLTEWEKQGTPVIRLQNLTGSGKDYYYSNLELPERQYCDFGDLLYMWSATFGAHIWKGPKAIYHYHIWKVTCDEVNITKPYLYQLLKQKTEEWMSKSNGMGILHVTKGSMEDMLLLLPPRPEQQKIAATLTAVDDVIESTQAQINKLKDLKTGMMQELLTKGIGHTEFKDSEVGRLPKAWNVISLEDITLEHKQGYYSKDAYTSIGAYVVRITDLSNPYITFEGMPRMVMSEVDFNAYKIIKGDFLFARSGAIGRYGIFDSDNEAVFASYLIRFRFNQDMALNKFVGYCYESDYCQFQLRAITQGSSNVNINAQNIKGLLIPLPSLPEQEKIVAQISSLDATLIANTKKMNALQSTKKALMQDLLTGKVRVKVN
ncbi:restriction endonuclease subunit S [Herminiimonas fonticola]|uniref:Type I restriction enzyme S subunit n=1 Tax=Herminiimonas fonticola TaxID=303380 RepID=A0A4R6G3S0_9BURK|nr:restriction endonuclease subunit S [Herminiimonas fonticola]RBA23283.1 Type I restriction modification DNA specificity domain [Herminiimonas fonticola]TDN89002.1 type I restriction enzyme S subunit [Herminiimonas fonticola]